MNNNSFSVSKIMGTRGSNYFSLHICPELGAGIAIVFIVWASSNVLDRPFCVSVSIGNVVKEANL